MDTVVLINRAHAETAFKLAEEINKDGSEIHMLFVGRGTHYLNHDDILKQLSFSKIYTFATELDSTNQQIQAISYDEFIRILEKCERTFTWI